MSGDDKRIRRNIGIGLTDRNGKTTWRCTEPWASCGGICCQTCLTSRRRTSACWRGARTTTGASTETSERTPVYTYIQR